MSRQREYQKRKITQGLCATCGKRPLFTSSKCKQCARRISPEKLLARLERERETKEKKLIRIQEIRKSIMPYALIDPTFEYVKVAKLLSAVAKKLGLTDEAIRRYYNKKVLIENKSILRIK
jgi:hypothetical protein